MQSGDECRVSERANPSCSPASPSSARGRCEVVRTPLRPRPQRTDLISDRVPGAGEPGSLPFAHSTTLRLLLRAHRPRRTLLPLIQRHGGANERLERLLVDLVALADIDGAPHVAFEAGVEQPRRVLQRGALGEGQLHVALVRLAGADDAAVLPHRHPQHPVRRLPPLHLLDHAGVRLPDERAHPRQRRAAPVAERRDAGVDQVGGGGSAVASFELVFFMVAVPRPSTQVVISGFARPSPNSVLPARGLLDPRDTRNKSECRQARG